MIISQYKFVRNIIFIEFNIFKLLNYEIDIIFHNSKETLKSTLGSKYSTYFDSIGSTINLSKATIGPLGTCNRTVSMQCLVALDAAGKPTNWAANG